MTGGAPPLRTLPFLVVPVLVGIVWMSANGAPLDYAAVNAAALLAGCSLALFVRRPRTASARRALAGLLLLVLFAPPIVGPDVAGISRWLSVGPFSLYAGALALPGLLVLITVDRPVLLVATPLALLAAALQPDAALAFALALGIGSIGLLRRDQLIGAMAVVVIGTAIALTYVDFLDPMPFVEDVFADAVERSIFWPIILALAALTACATLITGRADGPARFAIVGSFAGFVLASFAGPYPTVLLGYGAAPILGYGLALGLSRDTLPKKEPA